MSSTPSAGVSTRQPGMGPRLTQHDEENEIESLRRRVQEQDLELASYRQQRNVANASSKEDAKLNKYSAYSSILSIVLEASFNVCFCLQGYILHTGQSSLCECARWEEGRSSLLQIHRTVLRRQPLWSLRQVLL